jgi:hypothetical protein
MREYGERIQRPEYWKLENTRNRSGLED